MEFIRRGIVHFCPSGSIRVADYFADATDVHFSLKMYYIGS